MKPFHTLFHYEASRQQRTQIRGRPMMHSGPLCDTGDGHYQAAGHNVWRGKGPAINCPRCIANAHLLDRRERDLETWDVNARPIVVTL